VSGVDKAGGPGEPSAPSAQDASAPTPGAPELIIVTAHPNGGYGLATASGVPLGSAPPPTGGEGGGGDVVLSTPDGAVGAALTLSSRHVVVASDGDGAEIGRFEPAPGGGLRVLCRGAMAGRLVSWPDGTFGLVDTDENPLARFTFSDGGTTVETAPGLAPAIAHLAVLVPVALSLANRMPATPAGWGSES
jgi:hypothetical protein